MLSRVARAARTAVSIEPLGNRQKRNRIVHKGYQLSLLETGQGKGYLFGKRVCEKYLEQHQTTVIPGEQQKVAILSDWLASLKATAAGESGLEAKFVN
jgi:hypothetical protein